MAEVIDIQRGRKGDCQYLSLRFHQWDKANCCRGFIAFVPDCSHIFPFLEVSYCLRSGFEVFCSWEHSLAIVEGICITEASLSLYRTKATLFSMNNQKCRRKKENLSRNVRKDTRSASANLQKELDDICKGRRRRCSVANKNS